MSDVSVRNAAGVRRRLGTIVLVALATIALVGAVVLVVMQVGDVADSGCGTVFQAAFRHDSICRPRGRHRLYASSALLLTSISLGVAAWVWAHRK